jgi:hypothetical protein
MGDTKGRTYSYWSTQARTETDPVKKAAAEELVTTLFRGKTLRSKLFQAWAFWTMGDKAMYVVIGLIVAALLVSAALVFELFYAPKRETQGVRTASMTTNVA